jgi:hypothetical protein
MNWKGHGKNHHTKEKKKKENKKKKVSRKAGMNMEFSIGVRRAQGYVLYAWQEKLFLNEMARDLCEWKKKQFSSVQIIICSARV